MSVDQVRALLQKFWDGYAARDLDKVDEFMELFIPGDELEVIGTGGIVSGDDEWRKGPATVRELIARDWEFWGDVSYDVEGAHISVMGDVAWLATTGQVRDVITNDYRYNGYLGFVQSVLEDTEEEMDAKTKMLEIIQLGNELIAGILLGEVCVWPFRFTAVAVRSEGAWRFHQMQFSFASTRTPDVRTE